VGKLELSKKENEFIYHEKIPDLDTLQEIKGASLVSWENRNMINRMFPLVSVLWMLPLVSVLWMLPLVSVLRIFPLVSVLRCSP
jgi:hypothetical protein